MVNSMTGFGASAVERNGIRIGAELKSVNHRFFDLSLNVPHPLMYLEGRIKERIHSRVKRGALSLFLSVQGSSAVAPKVCVDWDIVGQYIEAAKQISLRAGAQMWDFSRIMELPGVFTLQEADSESAHQIEPFVLDAVDLACTHLTVMRAAEGARLRDDLLEKAALIEKQIEALDREAPLVQDRYARRLREAVVDFLERHVIDEDRLMNEVAIFADKSAVDEELTRMKSHLAQFRALLDTSAEPRPIGRQLDFLIQEMNREMNTIGSKGNSIEISRRVVSVKSEIEKLREQVQNVE